MASLDELRKRIRKKDRELVEAIAERIAIADEAGRVKADRGMPVVDLEVERAVIENAVGHGRKKGLDDSLTESIMRSVISHSRHRQQSASGDALAGLDSAAGHGASWRLPSPREMKSAIPLPRKAANTVKKARKAVGDIFAGRDRRTIIIMGPCSVHDPDQALEYATRVAGLGHEVGDRFMLVMRAYVEKSRTGKGWAGFLADPFMDGTGDVQEGVAATRRLFAGINALDVPVAVEFINPLAPLFIGDAVSWAAIGARSSNSQLHRALASGLPMPVGFKNGPDGDVAVAVNAVSSASAGHHYLGIDDEGRACAYKTRGNPLCHLVLRGGRKPNYDTRSVAKAQTALKSAGLSQRLMVDCSHGNSGKKARNQLVILKNVVGQIARGNTDITGLMLESSIESGSQKLPDNLSGFNKSSLRFGVSVTDECLGWEETEKLVIEAYHKLR